MTINLPTPNIQQIRTRRPLLLGPNPALLRLRAILAILQHRRCGIISTRAEILPLTVRLREPPHVAFRHGGEVRV